MRDLYDRVFYIHKYYLHFYDILCICDISPCECYSLNLYANRHINVQIILY